MTKKEGKITIIVNKKPFHVHDSSLSASDIRGFVDAPEDYEVWKIVKSPDPEGQLPIDDIQITDTIEVKNGDRFRVVPPGTFGSVATASQQLADEIEWLQREEYEVEVRNGNDILYIIVKGYPLPKGYNKTTTNLLLKIPLSYPNGNIDMFWTDLDLCIEGGKKPDNTSEEIILEENWLRFSWHPKQWNPGIDNLITFLEFVNRRLKQLK